MVPGIDGVGRTEDGQLRYFVLPDTALGAMAERTVIDLRRSVALPEGCDPVQVAAAMNPAMSSWIALRQRIEFTPGQSILILGATGNAGQLAVQVARYLGAGTIVAAGRGAQRLEALSGCGASETVALDDPPDRVAEALGRASGDVDIVLDYLWGPPTAAAIAAVVTSRDDRRKPLTWVEIGSAAGPTAEIPSAALRAARLQLVGSGQGSVSTGEIVDELEALASVITEDAFQINARAVPLAEVTRAWAESTQVRDRLVLTT
jgi:NADPH:quinone reductase-like Zn-dependent oxidoreductase